MMNAKRKGNSTARQVNISANAKPVPSTESMMGAFPGSSGELRKLREEDREREKRKPSILDIIGKYPEFGTVDWAAYKKEEAAEEAAYEAKLERLYGPFKKTKNAQKASLRLKKGSKPRSG